jgi:hypothetical protein
MAVLERSADQLSDLDIARIAREIARDLKPLQLVLEGAGISLDSFDRIQRTEVFQQHLNEQAALWAGTTKATLRERVATKAAMAIEELLVEAVELVRNKDIPGAARVQALQFIAKVGQLGEANATRDDGSGRVQINIMLGNQKLQFEGETIEGHATDVTSETV